MQQRAISSIGVVAAGILPLLFGGPVFAALMTGLCLVGFHEYRAIAGKIGGTPSPTGFLSVVAFGLAGLFGATDLAPLGAVAIAVALPLVLTVFAAHSDAGVTDWAFEVAGALYLGVPLYAAVALRDSTGTIEAGWLTDVANSLSLGWDAAPRGLAWLLIVILVTWLNDTGAYLVGRAIGRRPLAPRISPKKTIEGSLGGLLAAAGVGALGVAWFGLEVHPLFGAAIGLALGALGQIGDLTESMLKRRAGVKDSGTLIPGHGGILDRIDALLFALTGGIFLAALADRIVR